jgi:hypothetical protein
MSIITLDDINDLEKKTEHICLYRVMIGYEGNSSFYYRKNGVLKVIFSTFNPIDDRIALQKLKLFSKRKHKETYLDTTYYENYNGVQVPVTINHIPPNHPERQTFFDLLKEYVTIHKESINLEKNNKTNKYNKYNKTNRNNKTKGGTKKNRSIHSDDLLTFQNKITVIFFEMLLMIKLFHWKTHSYATHKATDELYSKFNEHMDKFIEVLLGKSNSRIELTNEKQISLIDLNNQEQLIQKVDKFKSYLVSLNTNKALSSMSNTDLLNIRDEILGDMNQFLYLLTFK